ncbi:MAG: FeoB-associated Cys-rich membrane protein [Coriobacteriales bacterium]|nr:FeoB-associated Cys-rich membrane protein [Coriobacteriales bacterium]
MAATVIISAILLVIVILIIRSLLRARKNSSGGCGCDCPGCTVGSTGIAGSSNGDTTASCCSGDSLLELHSGSAATGPDDSTAAGQEANGNGSIRQLQETGGSR